MEPTVHAQDPIRPTRGLCGAGYDWPSGVRLDRSGTLTAVTCSACRAKFIRTLEEAEKNFPRKG